MKTSIYLVLALVFMIPLAASPFVGLWLASELKTFIVFPLTPLICLIPVISLFVLAENNVSGA